MEEERHIQELERQIMINAMVPNKDTVQTQTEEAPRLMKQSRVISLSIAPLEVVLPTLKPPAVYLHED